MTRDEVLNEFQSFLDLHFADGESNVPNWRQDPYFKDLFVIYRNAVSCQMSHEDLVLFMEGQWNIMRHNRPATDQAKQIQELIVTLSAWDLYDRCVSRP